MTTTTPLFKEALRKARKEKDLTQTELAKKVGIALISVKRYESGDTLPDVDVLGSICIALQSDNLLDSWAYTKAKNKGDEEDLTRLQDQTTLLYKVKDIAYRMYWDEIVKKGTWKFQYKLVSVAQYFQSLNGVGIRKVLEAIDVISKVPEYKADSTWAFIQEQSKVEVSNGEEGNDSK